MAQILHPVFTVPIASGNAALSHSLKVVNNLSIATLVFSSILCTLGVVAFFAPPVTLFMAGTLALLNCFWINVPMLITSILGICGYRGGVYKHCPATAHLVFAIISVIATIGGLVILGLGFVGTIIILHNKEIIQNPNAPPIPQSALTVAYVGAGFAMAIYLFYVYTCIHCSVIYCKTPKNLAVYANISVPPVALVNDGALLPGQIYAKGNYSV